jgi:hypothetical protein
MMFYVEYISRRPGVGLAEFHQTFLRVQAGWESGYSEDQLIVNAARTWRLGSEPEYFTVWYLPNTGFDRIDEWERIFRVRGYESQLRQVARMDFAGCYDVLLPPMWVTGGIYYVEMFRPAGENGAVQSFYEKRSQKHRQFQLALLMRRIGGLGPDPGGLALWTLPSYAALGEIAADLDGITEPVAAGKAGVYVNVGREIL